MSYHEVIITVERERPNPEDGTQEIEVTIYGEVTPVVRGRYQGPPELCYPDEGGEIEVESATVNGQPFDLTDDELSIAEAALQEAADVAAEAAADARAEEITLRRIKDRYG